MDSSLRYTAGQDTPMPDTYFDFSETNGILQKKCNGSGIVERLKKVGGYMCPSYMATRNEKHTAHELICFVNNNSDKAK
jgi:hypothetical protein